METCPRFLSVTKVSYTYLQASTTEVKRPSVLVILWKGKQKPYKSCSINCFKLNGPHCDDMHIAKGSRKVLVNKLLPTCWWETLRSCSPSLQCAHSKLRPFCLSKAFIQQPPDTLKEQHLSILGSLDKAHAAGNTGNCNPAHLDATRLKNVAQIWMRILMLFPNSHLWMQYFPLWGTPKHGIHLPKFNSQQNYCSEF